MVRHWGVGGSRQVNRPEFDKASKHTQRPAHRGVFLNIQGAATMTISNATPVLAVDPQHLIPVSDHLHALTDIPPSRMFLINKSLKVYLEAIPGAPVYDASQGDGGASLPGVPRAILERAAQLQIEHGTAYDMPRHDGYRRA
jgi:hypothetical protein